MTKENSQKKKDKSKIDEWERYWRGLDATCEKSQILTLIWELFLSELWDYIF